MRDGFDGLSAAVSERSDASYRSSARGGELRWLNVGCELSEVLGGRSEEKLVLGTCWPAPSQSSKLEDASEVREQNLDALAIVTRFLERRGIGT